MNSNAPGPLIPEAATDDPIAKLAAKPEVAAAIAVTKAMHNMLGTYAVTNADDYERAAEDLARVKGAARKLDDLRKATVAPLNLQVKGINGFFGTYTDQLDAIEQTIKEHVGAWVVSERKRVAAEQAKADEAARKERERLASQAAAAEAAGKMERAEQLQQRASTVVAPVMQPKVSTAKGLGMAVRMVWKSRVRDASKVPRQFLMVDEAKLAAYAGAMKDSAEVEGVEFYQEAQVAGRSA